MSHTNAPAPPSLVEELADTHAASSGLGVILADLVTATPSRPRSLAITKIEEAIHWLGADAKRLELTAPAAD